MNKVLLIKSCCFGGVCSGCWPGQGRAEAGQPCVMKCDCPCHTPNEKLRVVVSPSSAEQKVDCLGKMYHMLTEGVVTGDV